MELHELDLQWNYTNEEMRKHSFTCKLGCKGLGSGPSCQFGKKNTAQWHQIITRNLAAVQEMT